MDRPWYRFYQENVPHSFDYPKIPLFSLLDRTTEHFPEAVAASFFGKKIRYRELQAFTRKMADILFHLGIRKGDRVAIMLPNCPQTVIAYFGALRLGAIVVNTNPLYVAREMVHQFNDAGAETLITLDLFYEKSKKTMKQTRLKRIIFTGVQDYLPFFLKLLYPLKAKREKQWVEIPKEPGIYKWRDLMKEANERIENEKVDTDDVALFQYTGGTTGVAKGVMLTHKNLVANAYQVRLWIPHAVEGREKTLAVLPFFHVYGMTTAMNFPILMGAEMILIPRFEIKQILQVIHKERPSVFPGVPTMYQAINMMKDVERFDLSSIKYCISGAAPLPLEVMKRFESLTGAKLVEGYGLTEASPVTHANPLEGVIKEGSIGIPFPDTDSKVVDMDTGEDLPVGQAGELCVKGPQVMKGYWNMPEETQQVLTEDGWLKTGDIARMDRDGYFYIVDRKKDMIIAGGYNIYPRDIDEVLFTHPKIQDAVTVGVPDPYRGETVKAFIVLKPGETATEEEIIAFCREKLARYKVPKLVEFRDELPKSLVGKVLRKVLREEEIKKYQQMKKVGEETPEKE